MRSAAHLVRLPAGTDAAQREAIALGVRPFGGVLGRDDDGLVSPEGAWITGLSLIERDAEHVERTQIVQETIDQVVIRVLPLPGYSAAQADHLLRNARARVPGSMRVRVETVETLERTALGKAPHVIRRPEVPSPGLSAARAAEEPADGR